MSRMLAILSEYLVAVGRLGAQLGPDDDHEALLRSYSQLVETLDGVASAANRASRALRLASILTLAASGALQATGLAHPLWPIAAMIGSWVLLVWAGRSREEHHEAAWLVTQLRATSPEVGSTIATIAVRRLRGAAR